MVKRKVLVIMKSEKTMNNAKCARVLPASPYKRTKKMESI